MSERAASTSSSPVKSPESPPASSTPDRDTERWLDLEVKLAYQERLIHELDTLVREFAERLGRVERELAEVKEAVPAPLPLGPLNEPPPHY